MSRRVSTLGLALATTCAAVLLAACSPGPTPDASPTTSAAPPTDETTASATTTTPPTTQPATDFYLSPGAVHTSIAQLRDAGRDADADLLDRAIASQPQAIWVGDWMSPQVVEQTGRSTAERAAEQGAIPLFVLYAIPGRDCGLHSAGGLPEQTYLAFVESFARGLAGSGAWVVLEPDALAQLGDCDGQGDRVALLAGAAEILADAGVQVYLDGGNSNWLPAEEVARRLALVGTEDLTGFSLNVSNYNSTEAERAYGEAVAATTGLRFVVDTSRNGRGGTGEWCNVPDQALGEAPRLVGEGALDAVLWIKRPGESDGTCGGGPPAGAWWTERALELARNAEADAA
jgi:endoglucanase